jgi:hypothetical protein
MVRNMTHESTMQHVDDEDLVLLTYDECDADERCRIEGHLAMCAECRTAREELARTLMLVDAAAVPEPGPAFERVMWARIQPSLARPTRYGWLRQFALVASWATVVAVVAATGYLGRVRRTDSGAPPTTSATAPAVSNASDRGPSQEGVLLTALDDHFSETEMLLVELMNAPAQPAELQYARSTADDLVTSGRLYRATAQQTGDSRLTNVIDDLEPVLVEVARSSDTAGVSDVDAWRTRIADDSLLFKVRAASNEVRDRRHTLWNLPQ